MHNVFLILDNALLLYKILVEQRKVLKINTIGTNKHLVFDENKAIKDNYIGPKTMYKKIAI